MKKIIVSFSLTGNNCALAKKLAEELKIDHIEVETVRKFKMGTLILDIIFKRIPKVKPAPVTLNNYDEIIFMGPMWMGQVATPLRAYFEYMKNTTQKYSFLSVCGGAKGGNQNLKEQFIERTGRAPEISAEFHIANLVTEEVKEDIKAKTDYKLSVEDVETFTQKAMEVLSW